MPQQQQWLCLTCHAGNMLPEPEPSTWGAQPYSELRVTEPEGRGSACPNGTVEGPMVPGGEPHEASLRCQHFNDNKSDGASASGAGDSQCRCAATQATVRVVKS